MVILLFSLFYFVKDLRPKTGFYCFVICHKKVVVHFHEVVIVVSITVLIILLLHVALQLLNSVLLANLLTDSVHLEIVLLIYDLAKLLLPIFACLLLGFLL